MHNPAESGLGWRSAFGAVFLDRDGVINRERADYVKCWHEVEILPGALDAIAQLAALGCPILVITNQSAIGRGIVTADEVDAIHRRLRDTVKAHGGRIDAFYVCPHHPDAGCDCRKPKPGLLLQAAEEHALDLRSCIFVGDSWTDREAAQSVGCESILVESGRLGEFISERARGDGAVRTAIDLPGAVQAILSTAQVSPRTT